ncbi:MAG: reverse transcriptase family protein, partial [Nitrosopumilus sp.]
LITSNLMVPHIVLPTRITSNSKTLIDNIFSNSVNFEKGISGNITASISDHLPQFLIIPKENYHPPKKHNLFKRDMKNFDKETFVAELININWNTILSITKGDPNHSFDMFNNKINQLLDKYAPLKKVTKKDFKNQLKPWITQGIYNSMKRRDKLLRKFIKAKDIATKNDLHQNYKTLRNQIVSLIRTSKKLHFQKYFTENSNNIRKTWKGIKNIINIRNTTHGQPISMRIGNEISTDPCKLANGFNDYFSSIAKNLQDKIHFAEDYLNYLNVPTNHSFLFESADSNEIILIIDSLDNNKATGPNSIPTDILKIIKSNIYYPLKEIINLSFATGIYPLKLKIAKVIPIFKNKGDPLNFSNYRPISLLSNINKIFEKLIYSRLYSFLNLHNFIYDLQFGFRAKHSTNHALISLTENIREALDDGKFACGIFIDLQKAFDTVDHHILLKKLEYYGIKGRANEWFHSYLTDRQQYVCINGFDSKPLTMKYGVPQGSVLGPLLFLIYINDLHKAIKHSTTLHFADDTNLLATNESIKKLQKQVNLDLRFLCKWLRANKISLNASKTELLLFRHPNKSINYDLKIKINGKKLIPSSSVKYLGIIIDCHLNWHIHINELSIRLSRAIGMLSKIRHYVKFETLRMIYHGIFSSILLYGSQIWGQLNNQPINKLQVLQNKALRTITFKPPRTSADPLFKECRILKLKDNIKLQNFLFAYDNLKNNLPSTLIDSFSTVDSIHSHVTRGATFKQYKVPSVRTQTYGVSSIKFKSVSFWNYINKQFHDLQLHKEKRNFCKSFISKFLLNGYV